MIIDEAREEICVVNSLRIFVRVSLFCGIMALSDAIQVLCFKPEKVLGECQ